ncbi:MAG: hypothetical protein KDC38_18645 [Planctomycetes bacterium]|nr:hypothetical protein [Planctomycetota bacterium]
MTEGPDPPEPGRIRMGIDRRIKFGVLVLIACGTDLLDGESALGVPILGVLMAIAVLFVASGVRDFAKSRSAARSEEG